MFEHAVECFGYLKSVCVCVLGRCIAIYTQDGRTSPFLSERTKLLVIILFPNFPENRKHFWCLRVCERGSSAVTAGDEQPLCSNPPPRPRAVRC